MARQAHLSLPVYFSFLCVDVEYVVSCCLVIFQIKLVDKLSICSKQVWVQRVRTNIQENKFLLLLKYHKRHPFLLLMHFVRTFVQRYLIHVKPSLG